MGNAEPEFSNLHPEQEHSGDEVDEQVAAQMQTIVGHFSTTMQEMRSN